MCPLRLRHRGKALDKIFLVLNRIRRENGQETTISRCTGSAPWHATREYTAMQTKMAQKADGPARCWTCMNTTGGRGCSLTTTSPPRPMTHYLLPRSPSRWTGQSRQNTFKWAAKHQWIGDNKFSYLAGTTELRLYIFALTPKCQERLL